MIDFDDIYNTQGKALNMNKTPLKSFKKKLKSPFKKALIKYSLIGGVLYILTSIVYFTVFLISLLIN